MMWINENSMTLTNEQERTELLQQLGKLHRRIKRRPHLAADAQAILFRLRELRQIARIGRNRDVTTKEPRPYA
jgi:hypothetical protein